MNNTNNIFYNYMIIIIIILLMHARKGFVCVNAYAIIFVHVGGVVTRGLINNVDLTVSKREEKKRVGRTLLRRYL